MVMKKEIYILIILMFSIISLSCIYLTKNNKVKEEDNTFNPYQEYSFYKSENLERYQKYYENNNNLDYKDIVLRVNMNLDYPFYTNTQEVNNFSLLMLINKYNYISDDFKSNKLVAVKEYAINGMYLEEECMLAFVKMAKEASSSGLNLRAISTYRTYDYQKKLYNNYVKNDGVTNADTYSARPGFSEHHTGLAVDIDNIKTSYTNFESTNEFKWMLENAYKYGFILRYPSDKVNITGYIYEPWHYRYVGLEVAKIIKENNLTFEEYYYEYLDK